MQAANVIKWREKQGHVIALAIHVSRKGGAKPLFYLHQERGCHARALQTYVTLLKCPQLYVDLFRVTGRNTGVTIQAKKSACAVLPQ